ncbi:MAG: RNA 2',3'-cyclic phosphodiesterase [Myxococcus sp.]|nr:RNA 2',3'-cyclic phosphodiesterase [Myxococcus sp.]
MSVFLAVDLDEPARAVAAGVIERLRDGHAAKWVRADKLHLTLVFLGNPSEAHVEAFKPLVDALATRHGPFSLSLSGAGTFGTARAPSVLWLGVGGALEALATLQADAATTLLTGALPGVKPDEQGRPYAPHVTLARAKHGSAFEAATAALASLRSSPFVVGHLTLYESRHDVYRPLHRAPLRSPVAR